MLKKKKGGESEEEKSNAELAAKISKMNLTEMRSYINNRIKDFPVCDDGLSAVVRRLIEKNPKTKEYYIKADDMDSKKKKAFDLILAIAQHKRVNIVTIELIQKFVEIYKDIIDTYDKEHSEIYASRFIDAINSGLLTISKKAALENKMDILGENKTSL